MKSDLNARGLSRKGNVKEEDALFQEYKKKLRNLGPVNSPEQAKKMREILREYNMID
jgi:hypothetical protein